MLDAIEAIRAYQVIFVFFLGLFLAFIGWAIVSRVKQLVDDRAKAIDLVSVGAHVTALEGRVTSLEQRFADMPTSRQMHEIAVSLAQIRGELQAGAERFKGLEALLERTTQQADSIDQFLRTRTN